MTGIPSNVDAAASTQPQDAASAPTRVRYVVLAMIFLITTLNYADRATLSVTGPAMRTEYGFGPRFRAAGCSTASGRGASMPAASSRGRCSR